MERQHLYKLIETKGTSSKEETNELWDIVRTFPYFQTARLLLAKSFQRQSSIHFHNELKTSAAYAADRKVLFQLIHDDHIKEPAVEGTNVFVIEPKEIAEEVPVLKTSDPQSENLFALSPERKEYIEEPVFEIKKETPALKYKEEPEVDEEEKVEEKKSAHEHINTDSDEPATTNEEIIRRRLSEILSRNKSGKQEDISTFAAGRDEEAIPRQEDIKEEKPIQPEPPITKEVEHEEDSVLDTLPGDTDDVIEGLELETIIEESYLQELEKLPEVVVPVPMPHAEGMILKEDSSSIHHFESKKSPLSFIEWLKQKSKNESTLEEVKDEPFFHHEIGKESEKPSIQSSELINKFIAASPSIAPIKAEFYSPANMARQSITDNEDVVSETLARIYFDQGNYFKARSCFEKLSLLYPEKSASFAPLIEKIDNLLKEEN